MHLKFPQHPGCKCNCDVCSAQGVTRVSLSSIAAAHRQAIPLSTTVNTDFCWMRCLHVRRMLPEPDRHRQFKHICEERRSRDLCQEKVTVTLGQEKWNICAQVNIAWEGLAKPGKNQGCYMMKLTCLQFAATASQSLVTITPHRMCAKQTACRLGCEII